MTDYTMSQYASADDMYAAMREEIERLRKELDAAQADAAKWRWLMQLSAVDVQSEYGEFTADMWNALGAVKRRF